MKKFLVSALALFVLGSFGSVFAQANTADHDLQVRIPNLLMLRITNGISTASVATPVVNFNFIDNAGGLTAYLALVEGGVAGSLGPTFSNFGDIVVLSNRGAWTVDVEASAFVFIDDVITTGEDVPNGAGLALSDITIDPSAVAGGPNGITSINDTFTLSTVEQSIAAGTRTQGWTSLGIGGSAYSIAVSGDEGPGTYDTTVTYTITAP